MDAVVVAGVGADMLYNCYLRNGIVYVPTVAKVESGAYMDIEPIAVVPVSESENLKSTFRETIARGNAVVPAPAPGHHPPPAILKYAGVKTFSTFARTASPWSIKERDGIYQIVGYRKRSDRGWEEDPEQMITLPQGTGIDEVCDRMVAILRQAAQST